MTAPRRVMIEGHDRLIWHAMMDRIRIAIALADEALDRAGDIMEACRALGFEADTALTGVGIFTGSIKIDRVASLRTVVGVAAVEFERPTQLQVY